MFEFFAYLLLLSLVLVFYFNSINGRDIKRIDKLKRRRQSLDDRAAEERIAVQTMRQRRGSPRRAR